MDSRSRAFDNIFVEHPWRSVKYEISDSMDALAKSSAVHVLNQPSASKTLSTITSIPTTTQYLRNPSAIFPLIKRSRNGKRNALRFSKDEHIIRQDLTATQAQAGGTQWFCAGPNKAIKTLKESYQGRKRESTRPCANRVSIASSIISPPQLTARRSRAASKS